jgi:hypothetical protein
MPGAVKCSGELNAAAVERYQTESTPRYRHVPRAQVEGRVAGTPAGATGLEPATPGFGEGGRAVTTAALRIPRRSQVVRLAEITSVGQRFGHNLIGEPQPIGAAKCRASLHHYPRSSRPSSSVEPKPSSAPRPRSCASQCDSSCSRPTVPPSVALRFVTTPIPDEDAAVVVTAFTIGGRYVAKDTRLRRDDPLVKAHPTFFRTPAMRLDG